MTYMDHILTMHAQKGPRVWLGYDYRFHVRKERTGAPLNVFNYPLYGSVKAKCKCKEQLTRLCHRSPFVTMVPETHNPALPLLLCL